MYNPVERARVRRQGAKPPVTTKEDDPLNPFESFFSDLFGGGKTPTPTPTPTPSPSPSITPKSTSSTSRSSSSNSQKSTSSTRSTSSSSESSSSTSSPPLLTPPPQTSNKSTVVVTQTSTSTSVPPANSDAAANNNQTSSGMSPIVMGIVIAASVIFGLIFFALITRKFFQYRRRQKRVSWADNIVPFAPPVNETGYEKPTQPAATTAAYPPPSRMFGSQDAGYGASAAAGLGAAGAGRAAGYGSTGAGRGDRVNSYNSTGTGYAAYQNYPAQTQMAQPYSPAAPSSAGYNAPLPYNTNAGIGAGAAAGAVMMAYNAAGAPPPPPKSVPPMPNPFAVSPADVAGPVPINAPSPPPAGQQILVVKRTFVPTLEDELSIATGESVRVLAVYDDGWCKVRKLGASNEEGVVPYECLESQEGLTAAQDSQLKRASSLYNAPVNNPPQY